MYKIIIYDASRTFRFTPDTDRYSLTLSVSKTLQFSSRRKALDFIRNISGLTSESQKLRTGKN